MKKVKNIFNNKLLIIICSIVLSIISLSSYFIIKAGEEQKKIIVTAIEDNRNIQISEIRIGGTSRELKDFANDSFKYNEEYNFLQATQKSNKLEIETNAISDVYITFIKNIDNGKVEIEAKEPTKSTKKQIETALETITFETYINSITIKEILFNSFINLEIENYIIFVISFIVITITYAIIIKKIISYIRIMNNRNLDIKECIMFVSLIFIVTLNTIYALLEIFNILLIIPIIILLFIIYKKYPKLTKRVENIFVIFATIIGLCILFIHPPYNVPDEGSHYYKAYQIANNLKINNKLSPQASIEMPKSVIDSMYNYTLDLHSTNFKLSAKTILADFNNKILDKEGTYSVWFGNVTTLPKLCYIPAAIILKLCTLFNCPVILSSILCRFINLLIFIVVVNKSIQIIPKFKKSLLTISLLPITLSQAAAINQDSITNTIFIFITANIFYLLYEEKNISCKKLIPIIIASVLLGFCKLVYFPVLFLLFLIPKEKFKNAKTKNIIVSAIIFINILITLLNILYTQQPSMEVNPNYYSMSMVFTQPLHTIKIVLNTMIDRLQLDMLCGVVNGFGWSTKWGKPLFTYIIQSIFLILYLTSNNEEAKEKCLNLKNKTYIFIIGLLIVGLIYGSLLTGYTSNDSTMIQGLQSRYFIPSILLFIISISNNIININIKNKNLLYVILLTLSGTITLFTMIYGFYI